jgi:hypothetical protein
VKVAIINRFISKRDVIMPPILPKLLDELFKDYRKPDDLMKTPEKEGYLWKRN